MAAGVDVVVIAEADHGWAPHLGRLAGDFLHDLHEAEGILALLRVGDAVEESSDADFGGLGFLLGHAASPFCSGNRCAAWLTQCRTAPFSGRGRLSLVTPVAPRLLLKHRED